MKIPAKKILWLVLVVVVLLISSNGPADAQTQGDQNAGAKDELTAAPPELYEIVTLGAKLSGRLGALENRIKDGPDISAIEKKFDGMEVRLKVLADQLRHLKDSKDYKYSKLVELRETIEKESELSQKTSEPLGQAIRQLGTLKKEWTAEKKQWNEWQSSLVKEGGGDQLKSTFERANGTIDTALDLVLPQLGISLALQEKSGDIESEIIGLSAELDGLIEEERRRTLLDASPPMFSSQYFSQFEGGLWYGVKNGLDGASWPDRRYFASQGWIILIQGFLFLFVIIAVYRNRQALNESTRWRFLAARPLSAGLFLAYMMTVLLFEYVGTPVVWKLANTMVAAFSFARLVSILIEKAWKRHFVCGLMIVLVATQLMEVFSFPMPLYRLYTVLTALVVFIFCLRWAETNDRLEDSGLYTGSLRLAALFFAVIMIAELWGKAALAEHLFESSIHSIATVLVFMLFMYMIRGGLEWLFRTSPLSQTAVLQSLDTDAIIRRTARLIDAAISGLVLLPGILMIWGVYDTLEGATKGLLALGFNLGAQRVSVGLLVVSAGILYGSFAASGVLQKLIVDEVLFSRQLEKGVRHSMARLLHYVIISIAFLFAISTLGFEITKLTIMISALGVGIGFGLQGVVNNFVSGLILLFERPVRVGDTVEIGGQWAEIKRIGLRSTTVQTFDQADLIIPNADLVNNQLINWTLSNRRVRLIILVGVAYGSDIPLVMETLMACASENEMVSKIHKPQVLFLSFGESSLDFELRVWVLDVDYRLNASSELHQEIDRRFREANIEISFPQRDLHLRSADEPIVLRSPESVK